MKETEWWYDPTTGSFILHEWKYNSYADNEPICEIRTIAIFKTKRGTELAGYGFEYHFPKSSVDYSNPIRL